jgi:hypothetical protein
MERTVHLIRGTFGSMMNTDKVQSRGTKIIKPLIVVYCLALRNEVQPSKLPTHRAHAHLRASLRPELLTAWTIRRVR